MDDNITKKKLCDCSEGCQIEYGYCHCNCGCKTKIAKYSDKRRGWIKGNPRKYSKGHRKSKNQIDENNCKKCSRCNTTKDISEFSKKGNNSLHYSCKQCALESYRKM